MIYLANLVDFIITCVDHPNARNKIFLASDNDDLFLTILVTLIRRAMTKPPLLIPVSMRIFKLLGRLSGKSEVVDRLILNLQVDSDDAKKYLIGQLLRLLNKVLKRLQMIFLKITSNLFRGKYFDSYS
jgi:UDP-glucose 4-epimerase